MYVLWVCMSMCVCEFVRVCVVLIYLFLFLFLRTGDIITCTSNSNILQKILIRNTNTLTSNPNKKTNSQLSEYVLLAIRCLSFTLSHTHIPKTLSRKHDQPNRECTKWEKNKTALFHMVSNNNKNCKLN